MPTSTHTGTFQRPSQWPEVTSKVCPGYLITLPQVLETATYHAWWSKSQLEQRLTSEGWSLTPLLVQCIDAIQISINAIEAHQIKEASDGNR